MTIPLFHRAALAVLKLLVSHLVGVHTLFCYIDGCASQHRAREGCRNLGPVPTGRGLALLHSAPVPCRCNVAVSGYVRANPMGSTVG
jgi:hypothetical protein